MQLIYIYIYSFNSPNFLMIFLTLQRFSCCFFCIVPTTKVRCFPIRQKFRVFVWQTRKTTHQLAFLVQPFTVPKTNSSHLEMDGWRVHFSLYYFSNKYGSVEKGVVLERYLLLETRPFCTESDYGRKLPQN